MKPVLWEVDAQVDFMLPGGKLYVPGAEKIIPNVNRLVEAARQGHTFLISSADAHNLDDPELREWPPHCVKSMPGAELIPEARAARCLTIPNQRGFVLPRDLGGFRQIILQKNTLDVFDNPNTDALLARLNASSSPGSDSGPDFLVFGVVTEFCVRCVVEGLLRRGFRISIVKDAIQSLDKKKGNATLSELQSRGARLISTDEALGLIGIRGSTVAA
ncbi:MAG TPA: isochorismatase family cysteine hydrolase [Candidatus Acidoferrum sp.]|nr:isochorismatase family cysteine hydrolase [Candidatus Acidoferrum sp.]